ncbi:MAG: hypothetical protein ACAF41_29720 [Leptolyngbya sp. BL-A-14]
MLNNKGVDRCMVIQRIGASLLLALPTLLALPSIRSTEQLIDCTGWLTNEQLPGRHWRKSAYPSQLRSAEYSHQGLTFDFWLLTPSDDCRTDAKEYQAASATD